MSVDQSDFRAALGRFASGVTVVTTLDAEGCDAGMTVSAFSSVSLDPPLVLICIDHSASIYETLSKATHFVANILKEEQEGIARRFAEQTPDRFDGIGYERAANGAAILNDVLGYIECDVVARHEAGDHDIIIASVEAAVYKEGKPLLYYRGGYAQLER